MASHTLPRVVNRARRLAASRLGAVWNREPGRKPIVMCGSRLPSATSRNSTPDTLHRSGNCKAEVNDEVVSIPPNYPDVLTP